MKNAPAAKRRGGPSGTPASKPCAPATPWSSGGWTGWAALLSDLIHLSAELQARGIHLESLSEGLHTGSPAGQGLWRAFGLLADFERHLSRERAAVGLKALRARGRPAGRPRKLQPQDLQAARALRAAGQVPVKAIAARLGVAPSTVYRNLTKTAGPDGSCENPPAAYA